MNRVGEFGLVRARYLGTLLLDSLMMFLKDIRARKTGVHQDR